MSEAEDRSFLGEDFLTWMWFRSETGKASFELPGHHSIAVMLDDFLTFGNAENEEMVQTLRHGLPTKAPEAGVALRSGRRLASASLIVAEGDEQWAFMLDARKMDYLSVKCPESDEDAIDASAHGDDTSRIQSFLRLSEIMDGIYRIFLAQRLRKEYETQTLPAIRNWVQTR